MSQDFVPMVPSAFENITLGKGNSTRIIAHSNSRPPGPAHSKSPQQFVAAAETAAPLHARARCEPKITVVKEGDKVTRIQVQCSCGEIIDLSCVY